MNRKYKFVISLLLLTFIFSIYVNSVRGDVLVDQTTDISENSYLEMHLEVEDEEGIHLRLSVIADKPIDIYVLDEDNYQNFTILQSWQYHIAKKGETDVSFEFEITTPGSYYIIIENGFYDTPSEGDVTVTILLVSIEDLPPFGSIELFLTLILIIPIIILIFAIILWLNKKRGRRIEQIEPLSKPEQPITASVQAQDLEKEEFTVNSPGTSWLWIFILFLIFFIGVYLILDLFGFGVISLFGLILLNNVFAFVIIITPFLSILVWSKLGIPIARKILINSLEKWNERKKNSFFARILGLKLDPDFQYYLETDPSDLNLHSVLGVFRNRIIEVISICLGITMIICRIILLVNAPFLESLDDPTYKDYMMGYIYFFSIISPLFAFWIVPFIWITKDLQVRALTQKRTFITLDERVHNGIFGKILGISGILLLFELVKGANYYIASIEWIVYIVTIFDMVLILLFFCALPYLIGILYLNFFHQKGVNNVRQKLKNILPLETTTVEWANETIVTNLSQTFPTEKTRNIFNTITAKTIITLSSYYFLVYAIWILVYV